MNAHDLSARQESGLTVRTIPASTFSGAPFHISLSHDEVDHGASAKIYKGKILGDNPLVVAVKDFGNVLGRVQEELLVRELRAARTVAMRHPFIVPFIGTAYIGQHKAIVLQYMPNGNLLEEYLKKYPEVDRGRLILQVAEAVNYLHTVERLVHGDIKCANVLISDSGDALLADFGLSTFIEQTATRTITAIRSMHTVSFAAPELLLGSTDPMAPPLSKTCQSDVYAFGMLVLEAVTGQAPFPTLSSYAIMFHVCSGRLPSRPIADGFSGISDAWWEVCLSCWSFNPVDRPTMQSVLQTLSAYRLLPDRASPQPEEPVASFPSPSSDDTASIASSSSDMSFTQPQLTLSSRGYEAKFSDGEPGWAYATWSVW